MRDCIAMGTCVLCLAWRPISLSESTLRSRVESRQLVLLFASLLARPPRTTRYVDSDERRPDRDRLPCAAAARARQGARHLRRARPRRRSPLCRDRPRLGVRRHHEERHSQQGQAPHQLVPLLLQLPRHPPRHQAHPQPCHHQRPRPHAPTRTPVPRPARGALHLGQEGNHPPRRGHRPRLHHRCTPFSLLSSQVAAKLTPSRSQALHGPSTKSRAPCTVSNSPRA